MPHRTHPYRPVLARTRTVDHPVSPLAYECVKLTFARHKGKVERYQRILAEELLYAREFTSEDARSAAIAVWNIHYNYHRPHSATDGQPPASRLKLAVTNVRPSYT
jgi:transposase InsO family protein